MSPITVDETTMTRSPLGEANGYAFIVHGLESWTDARALADVYMPLLKAGYNISLDAYENEIDTTYSVEIGKHFSREIALAGDGLKADYLKDNVAEAVKKLREKVIQRLTLDKTSVVVRDEDQPARD